MVRTSSPDRQNRDRHRDRDRSRGRVPDDRSRSHQRSRQRSRPRSPIRGSHSSSEPRLEELRNNTPPQRHRSVFGAFLNDDTGDGSNLPHQNANGVDDSESETEPDDRMIRRRIGDSGHIQYVGIDRNKRRDVSYKYYYELY